MVSGVEPLEALEVDPESRVELGLDERRAYVEHDFGIGIGEPLDRGGPLPRRVQLALDVVVGQAREQLVHLSLERRIVRGLLRRLQAVLHGAAERARESRHVHQVIERASPDHPGRERPDDRTELLDRARRVARAVEEPAVGHTAER